MILVSTYKFYEIALAVLSSIVGISVFIYAMKCICLALDDDTYKDKRFHKR